MKIVAKTALQMVAAGLVAFILSQLLRHVGNLYVQLGIGFIFGIFASSMHESHVHQHLGHAKTATREFWKRHPRICLPLIEGFFLHHIVHHAKTYREGYLEQFGESLSAEDVDSWAPEAFYRLFAAADQSWIRTKVPPALLIDHLHQADYGLGAVSAIKFASTVLPLVGVIFVIAPFWMAVATAVPMLFVYPAMSNTIHRNMMHVSQDGSASMHPHSSARWFVGTRLMQALERWHWMHHEYIYCNYNLLVLADFFRGVRRQPSEQDLRKMAQEGLVMSRDC